MKRKYNAFEKPGLCKNCGHYRLVKYKVTKTGRKGSFVYLCKCNPYHDQIIEKYGLVKEE